MAVDAWPAGLPFAFTSDSYAEGLADNRLRSAMDTGPAKVRGRSSTGPRPLSGVLLMSSAEIATFRSFVEDTLIQGALPFTFPDQFGGDDLLVRLAGDMPSWRRQGLLFAVSLSLEVLP